MTVLGNLIEQVRGVSYKPEDLHDTLNENSIVLLRANNIKDGELNFDDVVYVDKKKVVAKQLLRAGDILICASSGSKELVGKAAYVDNDLPMTFGAFCKVVRPKSECPKYIGHYFNSPYYRERISNYAAGANINNIRNEHIDGLEITWPSLEKRHEVVTVLDKLSELIALRKEQLAKLDQLVKSRFVEMFGDPFINPMNWKKIKIADAVTVEPQNGIYKPQSDYVTDGSGTPILRIDGFYNGVVTDFSSLKRLHCEDKERQKYLLQEDDIVISRVNSIEYLGKCAHITGLLEETVYESNMMRMHFDEVRFNPKYVTYLLCSRFAYDQIVNHAKKAVNQASINQKDVLDFDIYQPPIEIQNQFTSFVEQTNKSKLTIQASLDKLEVMKKALMQEYFG